MISEQEQEQASLYALGALPAAERQDFEATLRSQPELRRLVRSLQNAAEALARSVPQVAPPPQLRARVLRSVEAPAPQSLPFSGPAVNPAFFFVAANDSSGWKELPVRGAFIKLLSADRQRGYAVVLGRLGAGVRYPAHAHQSPEEIFLLTGDLTIAGRRLEAGDFHHCDAGTEHPVNYSEQGCTLLAVLSLEHDLAKVAMA